MAFQPVPNGVQTSLIYQWGGQICENVLGWHANAGFNATELQALDVSVAANWKAHIAPVTSNLVTLLRVEGVNLGEATGPVDTTLPIAPAVGGLAGASVPNNVTLAIAIRTPLRGRSYRGRIFHVGLAELQLADSTHVDSSEGVTILSAWRAFVNAVQTDIPAALFSVISRRNDGVERPFGVVTPYSDFYLADNALDSQRRRLAGRGR